MSESLNYRYVIDLARELGGAYSKILDFGCGRGQVVLEGIKEGMDIRGADTFDGFYSNWENDCEISLRGKLEKIEDGKIPFEDNSFDIVISNQVFEHIQDYKQSLEEIRRVLKTGGMLITLFPVRETCYEGHVGLYFPHYFQKYKRIQYLYMYLLTSIGMGFRSGGEPRAKWAKDFQGIIRSVCFYHPRKKIEEDFRSILGGEIVSYMPHFMRWRIGCSPKFTKLSFLLKIPLMDWLLEKICLLRGGVVFVIKKV